MEKKIILYIIIGIILLLVILSSFNILKFNNKNDSSGIPEECRKPEGQSLEQWKEHLGHHQNTLYCLEYYN